MQLTKKSQIVVLLSVIAIIAVLFMTPWGTNILPFATDNYGTDVTIDTKAKNTVLSGQSGSIVNYPFITVDNQLNHADLGEILDSSRYILSWQPSQKSTPITAQVSARWTEKYGTLYSLLYMFSSWPETVIQGDYWWDITLTDANGVTTRLVDGKNFTGGPAGQPNNDATVKKDWIYIQSGYPRMSFPGLVDSSWAFTDKIPRYAQASSGTYTLATGSLVFQIKGNHIGYLTVRCYLQGYAFANADTGLPPVQTRNYKVSKGPVLLSEDKAYLASGLGNVQVDGVNAIKSAGSETAGGTGAVYTKYVWAEGQNVTFNVKTGYSGISLEPDQDGYKEGWYLKISNSKGEVLKKGTIKRYEGGVWKQTDLSTYTQGLIPLADGLSNYKIQYQIPKGAWIANDPNDNEWMVTLSNTLFAQSETRLFVVDSLAKIPGQSKASFDKNQYKQWETCQLTLSAKGNPAGTGDVHHFRVWVTYDSWTSTNYALTARSIPAVKSGDTYTAEVTFQVNLGDKNLYATTVAIDSQGRAGPEGEDMAYVEQVIPGPDWKDIFGSDPMMLYILLAVIILVTAGGVGLYLYQKKGGKGFKFPKVRKK